LLYAGRVDETQGVATLGDALAGMPGFSLRVVGDAQSPEFDSALRERARAAGIDVVFRPAVPRSELAREYAEADAVVFPVEWFEPWGLVALEAMAVGRPVVATGRGGSGEYLRHEQNALLFPAGDVAALREALTRLAADAALRERLRAGGFETAAGYAEDRWLADVVREHEAVAR
jgi:glycosyltransferase involved in cell wall biosynthesis